MQRIVVIYSFLFLRLKEFYNWNMNKKCKMIKAFEYNVNFTIKDMWYVQVFEYIIIN